jgi:lysophospholipase L1-like esterase
MRIFKRVFFLVSVNLSILLVLLILADPFIEIKNRRNPVKRSVLLKEFTPFESYNVEPSDSYLLGTDGLKKKEYKVRTDNDGYLIGSNQSDIDTSKVDIIFFGGSTTACLFVEEDSRFPFLVQEKLVKQTTSQKIKVLNAGVSGNNTLHSLINFIAKGIKLKPTTVILMHNVNDLVLLSKTGSYWNAPETKSIVQIIQTSSNPTVKEKIIHFFKEIKDLLIPNFYEKTRIMFIDFLSKFKSHNELSLELEDEFENFRNLKKPDFSENQILYKQMLLSFINVAKANNINVVLMTQFNRFKPEDNFVRKDYNRYYNNLDYDTFCTYYSKFNQIIRELSKTEKVPLIDLDAKIPKSNKFLFDAVHLNTEGSQLVGDVISDQLAIIYPEYIKKK